MTETVIYFLLGLALLVLVITIFRRIWPSNVDTDFRQFGPGSIDTDEADPIAEADVYMTYGRDAQAEKILLEAWQKYPKRTAIAIKLLEVYSRGKNVKQFEALVDKLRSETGGVGPDWEKVVAMKAFARTRSN